MYRTEDQADGAGLGVVVRAADTPAFATSEPFPPEIANQPRQNGSRRWDIARLIAQAIAAHLRRFDFATDLAEDLGSKRWYRGLGVMLGLGGIALACWPGMAPLQAATAMRADAAAQDEFRSQMLLPLGLGADTGHHMGATALMLPLAAAPERSRIELVASLASGDSLGRMLQRAGVGSGDAARVAEMVSGSVHLADITPGTRFDLTLGQRPAPNQPRSLEKLAFRARFDLNIEVERRGSGLALGRRAIAVDATPLRIRGLVGGGLYRSARAAGAPMAAIQQYLQTLDAHFGLDDVSPGDMFDMVVAYKRSAQGEREVGDLLYAGLEHAGRSKAQLLRWGSDGQVLDAADMSGERRSSAFIMPVAGHVTSAFGMRFHPILGYSRMHAGLDLGAPYGSPIYAVADGYVSFAGVHGGHGNYVRLEHGGAIGTGYGHMSRIAVSAGTRVRAGQVIGYVGSTGLSTGPHLHYEAYRDGQTVDPMAVHFTVHAGVNKQELAAFRAKLANMLLVKPGAALGPVGANPLPTSR